MHLSNLLEKIIYLNIIIIIIITIVVISFYYNYLLIDTFTSKIKRALFQILYLMKELYCHLVKYLSLS